MTSHISPLFLKGKITFDKHVDHGRFPKNKSEKRTKDKQKSACTFISTTLTGSGEKN